MSAFNQRKRPLSKSPFVYALGLLARRDYSRYQLAHKLVLRGYPEPAVKDALDELTAEGWLDDFRYGEQLCRRLIERGYGPHYIRQALQQKGVSLGCTPRAIVGQKVFVDQLMAQMPATVAKTLDSASGQSVLTDLEALLGAYDDAFWCGQAEQVIQSFVQVRWQVRPEDDVKVWRRAFALLQRRGYPGHCVRKILGKVPVASSHHDL